MNIIPIFVSYRGILLVVSRDYILFTFMMLITFPSFYIFITLQPFWRLGRDIPKVWTFSPINLFHKRWPKLRNIHKLQWKSIKLHLTSYCMYINRETHCHISFGLVSFWCAVMCVDHFHIEPKWIWASHFDSSRLYSTRVVIKKLLINIIYFSWSISSVNSISTMTNILLCFSNS